MSSLIPLKEEEEQCTHDVAAVVATADTLDEEQEAAAAVTAAADDRDKYNDDGQEEEEEEDMVDDSLIAVAGAAAAAAAAADALEAAADAAVVTAAAAAAASISSTSATTAVPKTSTAEEPEEDSSASLHSKWNKNGFGAPVAKQSGKFSKEESDLVRKAVEEFCASKQISTARLCSECDHKAELKGAWMEIAKRIPHRSVQSVYRHGIRRLHPFKRGAWTEAEVTMLVELVSRLGKKWSTIQGKLNRSADSCRDKYREMSDDYVKGRWREQETELLKRLIREQVGVDVSMDIKEVAKLVEEQNIQISWSNISKRMGKRSRLSCFKKWQKMTGADGDDDTDILLDEEGALAGAAAMDPVKVAGTRTTKRKAADAAASSTKRVKTEASVAVADMDDYEQSAKMADETVAAVELPDARSSFV